MAYGGALGETGGHPVWSSPHGFPPSLTGSCRSPTRPAHPTELTATCAGALITSGHPDAALHTSLAALELLSHLRFAGRADAECFQAAMLQPSHAVTATIQAGAVPSEWQVVTVLRAAAQADTPLRLPTWLGHGFAATDARLMETQGGFQTEGVSGRERGSPAGRAAAKAGPFQDSKLLSNRPCSVGCTCHVRRPSPACPHSVAPCPQAAVEYAESYCTLLARALKQLCPVKLKAVLGRPLSHPGLTPPTWTTCWPPSAPCPLR